MNWATYEDPIGHGGGVALNAAGLIEVDTTATAVEVGKGMYKFVAVVTAIEVASNDEIFSIDIEANTRAATSTWKTIASISLGVSEITGRTADDAAGTYVFYGENPNDYQIRCHTKLSGSVATGINYTLSVYPLGLKR